MIQSEVSKDHDNSPGRTRVFIRSHGKGAARLTIITNKNIVTHKNHSMLSCVSRDLPTCHEISVFPQGGPNRHEAYSLKTKTCESSFSVINLVSHKNESCESQE